jgi:hypothetical protein
MDMSDRSKNRPGRCDEGKIFVRGKAVPQHTYGGAGGERMYISYSFTTSALDGVSD